MAHTNTSIRHEQVRKILIMTGFVLINFSILLTAYLMYNQSNQIKIVSSGVKKQEQNLSNLLQTQEKSLISQGDLLRAARERNSLLETQIVHHEEQYLIQRSRWLSILTEVQHTKDCVPPWNPPTGQPTCTHTASPAQRRLALRDLIITEQQRAKRSSKNPPAAHIDISGASIPNLSMSNVILDGSTLDHVTLERASLSHTSIQNASMRFIDAFQSDLTHIRLSGSNLVHANFDLALLTNAKLNGSNLDNARLRGADLSHADLSKASLKNADLALVNLSSANLSGADLSGANLLFFRPTTRDANKPKRIVTLTTQLKDRRTEIDGTNFTGALCNSATRLPLNLIRCNGGAIERVTAK